MVTSKLEFPVWKTKESIKVRQNSEIEYKYIIFKCGKFYKWESLLINRIVQIKNLVRMVIHDIQGKLYGLLVDSNVVNIEKFTKMNSKDENDSLVNDNNEEIDNRFDMHSPKIRVSIVI
jgi:hypothetical protein